ncbi:MAG: hypothetical protein ACOC8I_03830 [Desulfosalsimonas sp.]
MANTALKKEFNYYLNHQDEFVKNYNGKVIVIKDETVLGVYDNEKDAIETTKENHEMGTFFVQRCSPGEQHYSQTFRSRVHFN